MKRLLFVLVAFALSGCGSVLGHDCSDLNTVTGTPQWRLGDSDWTQHQPTQLYVNSQAKLIVEDSVVNGCGKPDQLRLDVNVMGPTGIPVTVDATPEVVAADSNHNWVRTTVNFTPSIAGGYLVNVHNNWLGTDEQRRIEVFDAQSVQTKLATVPGEECDRVGITNHGAIVCNGKVFRGTQQVDTVPSYSTVDGDYVWSISNGVIKVFRDTGSGALVQYGFSTPDAPAAFPEDYAVFAGDFFVLTQKDLTQYQLNSTGSEQKASIAFTGDFQPTRLAYLVNTVAVAGNTLQGPLQVCTFSLASASGLQPSSKPCQTFHKSLYGAGDGRIWIGESGSVKVQADPVSWYTGAISLTPLHLTGDSVEEERTLELPDTFTVRAGVGSSPLVYSDVAGAILGLRGDHGPFLRQLSVGVSARASGPYLLVFGQGVKQTEVFQRMAYEGTPN